MNLRDNRIGIYEKAIPNRLDWETKIFIAKSAGFDFIEMSVDESTERLERLDWDQQTRSNLVALLDKNKMAIDSMCLSGHRLYPFGSANEETRKKAYEIMDKALILAKDLHIKNIQLAGYDVYYEESTPESVRLFKEGLQYSAKKAEEAGIMLSIEIMDTPFIGTIIKGLQFVKEINSPFLTLYPDLGNLSRWSDNPSKELELGFDYISAIHLKDTNPGIFKCVPFGAGTVDFPTLFGTLQELNYQKNFLIEMWADNTLEATIEETINEIKKAKEWLYNRM
ncbi:MAG: L-ribulose-5-phosphate 3-epimerase [Bacilli bacterium]|nr:L-ribulose-5-phosphate 3-epimerase [Bacilli bacterium]